MAFITCPNSIISEVIQGDYLSDESVSFFHSILQSNTQYRPRNILLFHDELLEHIEAVSPVTPHLQLIARPPEMDIPQPNAVGHWVLLHYDGQKAHIYDSLCLNNLSVSQENFINGLLPHKPELRFHDGVQKQGNNVDCGVYAIAYAMSIVNGKDPEKEKYEVCGMRAHLAKILQGECFTPFPSIYTSVKCAGKVTKTAASEAAKRQKEREKKRRSRAASQLSYSSDSELDDVIKKNSVIEVTASKLSSATAPLSLCKSKSLSSDSFLIECSSKESLPASLPTKGLTSDTLPSTSTSIKCAGNITKSAASETTKRQKEREKKQRSRASSQLSYSTNRELRDVGKNEYPFEHLASKLSSSASKLTLSISKSLSSVSSFSESSLSHSLPVPLQTTGLNTDASPSVTSTVKYAGKITKTASSEAVKRQKEREKKKRSRATNQLSNSSNIELRDDGKNESPSEQVVSKLSSTASKLTLCKSKSLSSVSSSIESSSTHGLSVSLQTMGLINNDTSPSVTSTVNCAGYATKSAASEAAKRQKEREKKKRRRAESLSGELPVSLPGNSNKEINNNSPYLSFVDVSPLKKICPPLNNCLANDCRAGSCNQISKLIINSKYNEKKQLKDRTVKNHTRSNIKRINKTQQKNSLFRKEVRADPVYRAMEQIKNTRARVAARQDPVYRGVEQSRDSRARSIARRDPAIAERDRAKRRVLSNNWQNIKLNYFKAVQGGYTYPCNCCGRLWPQKSVSQLGKHTLIHRGEVYINNIFNLNANVDYGDFCRTCISAIKRGKIPKLARCNGLKFPEIPPVLNDLTALEERLLCPRHVFLKIVRRGQGLGFQHGLCGNVVNVPVEVDSMVSSLPRAVNDDQVITLELRRKMCYNHGRKETIRPYRVQEAAAYLVQCPLFKELNISLNENWVDNVEDREDQMDVDDSCTCQGLEEGFNPGGQETMVLDQFTLIMAPGEGKRPLSLIYDEHLEELAFIKVHCGEKRAFKVKLSHMDVIKSEITRADRRAVRPDYLFTALKKQHCIKIKSNIMISLRKKINNGVPLLAENLLDEGFIDNLIQHNEGYRFLKNIKNSPSFWENEKKKVLAMIRQFGLPTLFITLSAAETRWDELIQILKVVVDKDENFTVEDAKTLPYSEKARLIQSDPFICATYFDNKLREIRKTWKFSTGPFNDYEITHFFYRIEFQHRGSPHAHIMLWLKGAPLFEPGNSESFPPIISFVDNIITCRGDTEEAEVQIHRHTHTCNPKPGRPCRFDIPFFPMDSTRVLLELSEREGDPAKLKEVASNIKTVLENLPSFIDDFNSFLIHLNLNLNEYLLAIRSTLTRPKLFLKRRPKDIFVNPYCKKILELHNANMDIQYIFDPFACCMYIVNYINKADRGLSLLLRSALEEVKENPSVREALRAVGNVFLNASEISAQEAIYSLMRLPISLTSESEVFINTGPAENRTRLLKSFKDLEKLHPKSSNLFVPSLHDYYINRPDILENISLIEFAASYNISSKSRESNELNQNEESEGEESDRRSNINSKLIKLKNNMGYIYKRVRPKIVRFCRFNELVEPDKYFYEQLMLYLPWRNENDDIKNIDTRQAFLDNLENIRAIYAEYNQIGDSKRFDELLHTIKDLEDNRENSEPEIHLTERGPLSEYEYEQQESDIMIELGLGQNSAANENLESGTEAVLVPSLVDNDEFLNLIRSLNFDQRSTLLHIYSHIQNFFDPIHLFISGGAGVGKSLLIRAIFQTLTRHFNSIPGSNPNDPKVLLCAPTGKAAFGIGGQTLHNAFGLPVTQAGYQMVDLSPSIANKFACKLATIKILIIDEISMVGSKMFNQVNKRLRQILQINKPFGGLHVICVGDLKQLAPVGDSWIFQPDTSNPLSILAGQPLWELFSMVELTQCMRQRDDIPFANALNNMASGTMTAVDVALILSRTFDSTPPETVGSINLFSSNREVDAFNNRRLASMKTEGALSTGIDRVTGECRESAKSRALNTVLGLPTAQTYGLPRELVFKIGARYMLTVNVDTADGLVNGATGMLRKIDFGINSSGDRRPLRVWIEFDDATTGRKKRQQPIVTRVVGNKKYTPIETVTYTVKRWKSTNLQVQRTQFPLVPAEAITIHKSQGATLDKVVVHLGTRIKCSMAYVACSRARNAQGLFVVSSSGFKPPTSYSTIVKDELQRLRENPLVPIFGFLSNRCNSDGYLQIVFHNTQSLRKHLPDMIADPIFLSSDLILLVETWSCSSDKFLLDGYCVAARTDGPKPRMANSGYGSICFTKDLLKTNVINSLNITLEDEQNGHCEISQIMLQGLSIGAVYKSPKCSEKTLVKLLSYVLSCHPSIPHLLFGDFNLNLSYLSSDSPMKTFLFKEDAKCLLDGRVPTTTGGSKIDNILVFNHSKLSLHNWGIFDTFYSYHKPLWLKIRYPNTQ